MLSLRKISGLAAAALVASAFAASANTLTTVGPGTTYTLDDPPYDLSVPTTPFDIEVFGAAGGSVPVSGATTVGSASNGLSLSAATFLRFTLIGEEADDTNVIANGGTLFNNEAGAGASAVESFAAGIVDFKFIGEGGGATNTAANKGTIASGLAIGFFRESATSYLAFFDDGGGPSVTGCSSKDCDFDDMVVRIEVVPLPAAAWLLLAGLGGMGLVARRRKAA